MQAVSRANMVARRLPAPEEARPPRYRLRMPPQMQASASHWVKRKVSPIRGPLASATSNGALPRISG